MSTGAPVDQEHARAVLGVPLGAGPADVRRAYRRLARELHPDAGGDAARFHEATTALRVLEDGDGAAVRTQERAAAVQERWWDGAGAWHDEPVEVDAVALDVEPPDRPAVPASVDLLATLLAGAAPVSPVVLRSRAPASRLHRMIAWLEPDLLAALSVHPAPDGARAGHDVEVTVRAAGGRGRRHLGDVPLPSGWTRHRGSESVSAVRRFRPCRTQEETAVRVAQEVGTALTHIGWALPDWYLLRV